MPNTDEVGSRSRRVGVAVIGLVAVLFAFTVVALLVPELAPAFVNGRLDAAISSFAMLASAAVAVQAWGRHREAGEGASLYRSAGFLVLAVYNGFVLIVQIVGAESRFGMTLEEPGQLPLWGTIVSRGMAAALFVVAGVVAIGRARVIRWPDWGIVLLPAALLLLLLAAGWELTDRLPILADPAILATLAETPEAAMLDISNAAPLVIANVVVALLFVGAAWLAAAEFRGRGALSSLVLAAGLTVAAFAQLHASVHPDAYAALVTPADLLRLLFYLLVAASFLGRGREDVRELRLAHLGLQRLREAELAQATLEERGRLAREIHDGLAQDLWYAKLKQARLAGQDGLTDEARTLAGEVADALDAALADARQAVLALRPSEGASLGEVLERFAEDFSDRFGLRVEVRVERAELELPARVQAELLRIVQEALNNVRKHADASLVRLEAVVDGEEFRVVVADNGRGFDPHHRGSGYGLRSMEERAAIAGASLEVDARPRDGTRVVVRIPVQGGGHA